MFKNIFSKLIVLVFVSCVMISCKQGPYYEQVNSLYKLPEELSDCKAFDLKTYNRVVTVFRCPNSTTTTVSKNGKETETVVVNN